MRPRAAQPRPSGRRPYAALLLALAGRLLAICAALPAQDSHLEHLEHLGVEDGLAHTTVWDVHQDSRGFLWIATESYLQRYDGYDFRAYKHDPDDPDSLSESQVMRIYEDGSGTLWFGTRHAGVNRYHPAEDRFVRHLPAADDRRLTPGRVFAIAMDTEGALWVGTAGGLNRLDPETGMVRRHLHDPADPTSPGHDVILGLLVDRTGELWVGTFAGLDRLDRATGAFVHYRHDPADPDGLRSDEFSAMFEDRGGTLWIGTWDGNIHRYERRRDAFVAIGPDPRDTGAQGLRALADDRAGNLWLGTGSSGLIRLEGAATDPARVSFTRFAHDPDDPRSLSSDDVLDVLEDRAGVLWIATKAGLDKLASQRQRFTLLRHRPGSDRGLPGPNVMGLAEDTSGVLWIGTLESGIAAFDPATGTLRHVLPPTDAENWPRRSVKALLEDRSGQFWVGSDSGLGRLVGRPDAARFVPEPAVGSAVLCLLEDAGFLWAGTEGGLYRLDADGSRHYDLANGVYDLLQDGAGGLWLATEGGLLRFDPAADTFDRTRHDPDDPDSPGSDNLVALHRNDTGLWLGNYGAGLDLREPGGSWRHYREKDGLASDNVVAILGDAGDLWLATNGGLSRFDPRAETFRNYDLGDGLSSNVFYIGAALHSARGELYFGGSGGITAFDPEALFDDPLPPPVVLTELWLGGEPAPLTRRSADSPLARSITETRELTLDHRHRTFAFEFAAPHFVNPRKNRYAYRLDGWDPDWIETDAGRRLARYTNLDPGEYVFRVKASNQDGVWNQQGTSVRLLIRPPPWKTWWAYTLYGLTLGTAVAGGIRWQTRKLERERAISSRLRDVDRLKDEFLANTSHELRTPLQGITGLAESLLDGSRGELTSSARTDLAMLAASGHRLTGLVDDLLDLSRLEHHRLELDRRPVDLYALAEMVLSLSRPLLPSGALELENAVPRDLPPADADERRLQQVLHNLVDNAIKFTDAGRIRILARRQQDRLVMVVSDTGIGIPQSEHELIFEAFRQAEASTERRFGGTGLGLAVCRQLVELHGGRIWVESSAGEGSSFLFTLPIAEGVAAAPPAARSAIAWQPEAEAVAAVDEAPGEPSEDAIRILVVDDEPVNRRVLHNFLSSQHFETRVAVDGEEALRLLEEQSFDLVLLDIMMPKMSGYEVCRILRQRHPIEELPILFLSAKTRSSDIVAGLSLGANDYLVKPISKAELLARVRPHIDLLQIYRHLEDVVDRRMSQIKVLRGLLPMCCVCKKIRDDQGTWNELETFIDNHSEAALTHGLCPDCVREHYDGLDPAED